MSFWLTANEQSLPGKRSKFHLKSLNIGHSLSAPSASKFHCGLMWQVVLSLVYVPLCMVDEYWCRRWSCRALSARLLRVWSLMTSWVIRMIRGYQGSWLSRTSIAVWISLPRSESVAAGNFAGADYPATRWGKRSPQAECGSPAPRQELEHPDRKTQASCVMTRHDSSPISRVLGTFWHILAHSGTWPFDSFDSWSDLFRSSQVSGALRGGLEMYPRISLEPQRSSCLSLRETGSAKNPWILQKWRWMLWIFVDDENDSWNLAETRLKQVESPESSCGTSAPSASVLPGAWWELCQLCQLGRNIWPKYMPPN